MNDKDVLQKFFFENASVRGEIVHLNTSYQTIIQQHPYSSLVRQLLGEALTVACLLSALIKGKGCVTVQFRSNGKLKLLIAQCDGSFHIRGLVQHEGDLSRDELLEAQQQGVLTITVDSSLSSAGQYQGIVTWRGETFAEAIEGYFMQSEQLPTRLWLSVNETSAAGLLLQILPNEKPELFKEDWNHLVLLTDTLKPKELLLLDNTTLLHRLYSQEKIRIFEKTPIIFRCTCSVKRCENAILVLGEKEAEQELVNKQKINVICEFCNKDYSFDRVDVAAIFKKGGYSLSSTQIH